MWRVFPDHITYVLLWHIRPHLQICCGTWTKIIEDLCKVGQSVDTPWPDVHILYRLHGIRIYLQGLFLFPLFMTVLLISLLIFIFSAYFFTFPDNQKPNRGHFCSLRVKIVGVVHLKKPGLTQNVSLLPINLISYPHAHMQNVKKEKKKHLSKKKSYAYIWEGTHNRACECVSFMKLNL